MNAMLTKVQSELFKKFQNEIVMAIALILLSAGAGYNISDDSNTITFDSDYNVFEARTEEVSRMIDIVLANPTEENLVNAQQNILYEYAPWANRQTGEQKDLFLDYLEACNQIIIDLSNGEKVDTTEMYELYSKLNPTAPESKIMNVKPDPPLIWETGVTSMNF